MNTLRFFLLAPLICAETLFAATPDLPDLFTCGYINGAMNIALVRDPAVSSYEVQMRASPQETWQTIAGEMGTMAANGLTNSVWHKTFYYDGNMSFRIRAVNSAGVSEWLSVGEHHATVGIRGKVIGNLGNDDPGKAFDGNLATFVDATVNNGDDAWVGYLFDHPVSIRKIRFLPRLDHQKLAGRYRNSLFEADANASFSNPQKIYEIPSNYLIPQRISECTFDPPITAKAFRHWKAKGGYEQSAELEFISVDVPFQLPLTLTETSPAEGFFPVFSCTFPEGFHCVSSIVERAYYPEGPWGGIGEWNVNPGTTFCMTNTMPYTGIQTYYRLRAVTGHSDYLGLDAYSPTVTHTHIRRLDRDPQDEAHLLNGVSIMRATNGTVLPGVGKAFDGNLSTFPDFCDNEVYYRGPLGLKFEEPVWVSKIGYICRNDNWCHIRIRNAAVFCASGNDPELKDKVQISDKIAKSSQDTTFYTQETRDLPLHGAHCYFLWAPTPSAYDFYGNVAELSFYGWTQSDIDRLPVVSSPEHLVIHKEKGFPELTWSPAKNARGYTIERRVQGSETWEVRASEIKDTAWADLAETTLLNTLYEYRVIADGGELGSAPSEIVPLYLYELGEGTGLRGWAMWPYRYDSSSIYQLTNGYEIAPAPLGFTTELNQEVFPGVTNDFRVTWSGEIIIPIKGSYTFTLETKEMRGAILVNKISVANEWTQSSPVVGMISLEKGRYPIRVEARTSSTPGARHCKLLWSGPMPEEEIPVTQLVPSPDAPVNRIGEWTSYCFAGKYMGFFDELAPNQFAIRFSGGAPNGWNDRDQMAFLCQHLKGSYSFESGLRFQGGYGTGALLARDAIGHLVAIEAVRDSYDIISHRMSVLLPGEQRLRTISDTVQIARITDYQGIVKLTREGGKFTGYYKKKASDQEWTELAVWSEADHPEQKLGSDLYWGMACWGGTDANLVFPTFLSPTLQPIVKGTLLLLR